MSLATISNSDRAALNELIGKAMLYDDLCSVLLKRHTRMEALKKTNLSLNLWLRIMSFEDAQDIYDFASRLVQLLCPQDTLM
jgi:hypothetical protein